MTHQLTDAPITEDDAFLAAALEHASIATLLMSIVHLTGDASLLRGPIRPQKTLPGEADGGLTDADKASVRAQALAALRAYRDRGCTLPPPPAPATIREMMSFMVGEAVPDEYVPMFLEEMALDSGDARDGGEETLTADALISPGTNLAHAGSIIFHAECQVRYVMGCLVALLSNGFHAMECRQSVHDAYAERFDARHRQMVWSHPGMNSWYKNAHGRVLTTSPWRLVDYWGWTKVPALDDYELR